MTETRDKIMALPNDNGFGVTTQVIVNNEHVCYAKELKDFVASLEGERDRVEDGEYCDCKAYRSSPPSTADEAGEDAESPERHPSELTQLHNLLCNDARKLGVDLGSSEWPHLSLYKAISDAQDVESASLRDALQTLLITLKAEREYCDCDPICRKCLRRRGYVNKAIEQADAARGAMEKK